jgi:hypothetical protein
MRGHKGRRAAGAALIAAVVLLPALPAMPALAHSGSSIAVPVLEELSPALPDAVTFELIETQVASLLEVRNPTNALLEVAQRDGRPWLRISATGVEVDAGAVDTYASTNPTGGSVPRDVLAGERPSEWVRVTSEPIWAWFEHRLHPEGLVPEGAVPDDAQGPVRLLDWTVPLRYDGDAVELRGSLQLRPATGIVEVALTSGVPDGVVVQLLDGGIPGILLTPSGADEVVVIGISGEDYLRFSGGTVEVDTASPTHRAVEAARGNALPALAGPANPTWEVATGGDTYLWLETRAQVAADIPASVREGGEVVDLKTWQVPLRVDGAGVLLSGVTRWVPLRDSGSRGGGDTTGTSAGALPVGALAVVVVCCILGVMAYRRVCAARATTS